MPAFLLFLAACDSDKIDLSLPPKTEEGRNTLGFLSNGHVWVNYGQICNWGKCDENVVAARRHTYPDGSHAVIIEAQYNDPQKGQSQTLQINAQNIKGPGTYLLDASQGDAMNLITDWSKNEFYQLSPNSRAKLVITRLDTVQHIISGEFSGTVYLYPHASAALEITDGRFDTKLTYSQP